MQVFFLTITDFLIATVLAAEFSSDLYKFPISWTGHSSKSAAQHRIQFWTHWLQLWKYETFLAIELSQYWKIGIPS